MVEAGGFRTVIAEVNGDKVYSKLKYEAGVHRVQVRVFFCGCSASNTSYVIAHRPHGSCYHGRFAWRQRVG